MREQVLRDGLRYVAAHGLDKSYAPVMKYLLADLLLDLGRWDEAHEILEEVVTREVTGVPAMFTHAYRARLAAARGRSSTATACADRVAALSRELPQQPIPQAIALCAHAESCLWSGDLEQAMQHADQATVIINDPMGAAEAREIHARAAADLAERARMHGQPVAALPPDTEGLVGGVLTEHHPRIRTWSSRS